MSNPVEKEPVQLWLAALRSGKYQQARGCLATSDGSYCCLGVACEVFIENGGDLVKLNGDGDSSKRMYLGNIPTPSDMTLPEPVKQWLGLRSKAGEYRNAGVHFSLSEKNDHGMTFGEIAALIESNPQGLFITEKGTNDGI